MNYNDTKNLLSIYNYIKEAQKPNNVKNAPTKTKEEWGNYIRDIKQASKDLPQDSEQWAKYIMGRVQPEKQPEPTPQPPPQLTPAELTNQRIADAMKRRAQASQRARKLAANQMKLDHEYRMARLGLHMNPSTNTYVRFPPNQSGSGGSPQVDANTGQGDASYDVNINTIPMSGVNLPTSADTGQDKQSANNQNPQDIIGGIQQQLQALGIPPEQTQGIIQQISTIHQQVASAQQQQQASAQGNPNAQQQQQASAQGDPSDANSAPNYNDQPTTFGGYMRQAAGDAAINAVRMGGDAAGAGVADIIQGTLGGLAQRGHAAAAGKARFERQQPYRPPRGVYTTRDFPRPIRSIGQTPQQGNTYAVGSSRGGMIGPPSTRSYINARDRYRPGYQ